MSKNRKKNRSTPVQATPVPQVPASNAGEQKVVAPLPQMPPASQGITLDQLKSGYVVGLTKEGNFIFEVVGEQKGIVELAGLHSFAGKKVEQVLDASQRSGDRLVLELARGVADIAQRVEQIAQVVLPRKKPDNSLGQ